MSKNSDKPNLGSIRKLPCVDLDRLAELCGEQNIPGNPYTFDPFVKVVDHSQISLHGYRSREVLRQAVIRKARKQGRDIDVWYRDLFEFDIGGQLKINRTKTLYFTEGRPEAFAWAEALFWLDEQEKGGGE